LFKPLIYTYLQLRIRNNELSGEHLTDEINSTIDFVEERVPFIDKDRPLEHELRKLIADLQSEALPLSY